MPDGFATSSEGGERLCYKILSNLSASWERTSDLFNSGQELGGLQPLSF
jgi:hypothetical protein